MIRLRLCVVFLLMSAIGCGDDCPPFPLDAPKEGQCDDTDSDSISRADEGDNDTDSDGVLNYQDHDSDGDGTSDAMEAGDDDCTTSPIDTDSDGIPDFLDTDGNGDGVEDKDQPGDLDGDGIENRLDLDTDGDDIPNSVETDNGVGVDSDEDGSLDSVDVDSDNDTISDKDEGTRDPDEDQIPNFRDPDSDDDGVADAREVFDSDLATPPTACAIEVDPNDASAIKSDGLFDFEDVDSDNDGSGDLDEALFGTDPCGLDSDDDGLSDLIETAYEKINCPERTSGTDCGCATDPDCQIPEDHFYIVLPYRQGLQNRDLTMNTEITIADVFFLSDTTESMGKELAFIKSTVGRANTGLVARIVDAIPNAHFGGGQHDDFPLAGYGSVPDETLSIATPMLAASSRDMLSSRFASMRLHDGGDGPESATEALYQLMTGDGGSWTFLASTYDLRSYQNDCFGGWGAACFRDSVTPIIVHFTDFCSHNGPADEDARCTDYAGITPAPATHNTAVEELTKHGARYIGINTSRVACRGMVGLQEDSPCHFMRTTAAATGSVDAAGAPLVYDLVDGGQTEQDFIDTIADAVEVVATQSKLGFISSELRDDPTDATGVITTRFIKAHLPACAAEQPTDPCWSAPQGSVESAAVGNVDTTGFSDVVPGTRIVFRIALQNDFYPGDALSHVFIAYIDARSSASVVVDTQELHIVTPVAGAGLQ